MFSLFSQPRKWDDVGGALFLGVILVWLLVYLWRNEKGIRRAVGIAITFTGTVLSFVEAVQWTWWIIKYGA